MANQGTAHYKKIVQTQLAEFLECRWVALYPTVAEALYELQESVLGASFSHQIIALCDERSEQYSLLSSIMGSHPVDRVHRVGPRSHSDIKVADKRDPELLWWESVPYPEIFHIGVESGLGNFSGATIRVTDVTLSPLATQSIFADYYLMSDMRGIVGHSGYSCAALVGASLRAGAPPRGEAVSTTSLNAIEGALRTARQRLRTRIQNAIEIENHFRASNFAGTAFRPNIERAAWIISIRPETNARAPLVNSDLINPILGQDTSSLALVREDIGPSDVTGYLLSVGLEPPNEIVNELNRLSVIRSP